MFNIYKDDIERIMGEAREKFPVSDEQLLDNGAIFYMVDYSTEIQYAYHNRLCFAIYYKDDTPYIKIDLLPNNAVNVFIYGNCDGEDVCGRYKVNLLCVRTVELVSIMSKIADKQCRLNGRCHIDDLTWIESEKEMERSNYINHLFDITERLEKNVEYEEHLFNSFVDNGRYTPFQEVKVYKYENDSDKTATIISYKNVVFCDNIPHLIKSDTLTVYENGIKIIANKPYKDFNGAKTAMKKFLQTWQEIE